MTRRQLLLGGAACVALPAMPAPAKVLSPYERSVQELLRMSIGTLMRIAEGGMHADALPSSIVLAMTPLMRSIESIADTVNRPRALTNP